MQRMALDSMEGSHSRIAVKSRLSIVPGASRDEMSWFIQKPAEKKQLIHILLFIESFAETSFMS